MEGTNILSSKIPVTSNGFSVVADVTPQSELETPAYQKFAERFTHLQAYGVCECLTMPNPFVKKEEDKEDSGIPELEIDTLFKNLKYAKQHGFFIVPALPRHAHDFWHLIVDQLLRYEPDMIGYKFIYGSGEPERDDALDDLVQLCLQRFNHHGDEAQGSPNRKMRFKMQMEKPFAPKPIEAVVPKKKRKEMDSRVVSLQPTRMSMEPSSVSTSFAKPVPLQSPPYPFFKKEIEENKMSTLSEVGNLFKNLDAKRIVDACNEQAQRDVPVPGVPYGFGEILSLIGLGFVDYGQPIPFTAGKTLECLTKCAVSIEHPDCKMVIPLHAIYKNSALMPISLIMRHIEGLTVLKGEIIITDTHIIIKVGSIRILYSTQSGKFSSQMDWLMGKESKNKVDRLLDGSLKSIERLNDVMDVGTGLSMKLIASADKINEAVVVNDLPEKVASTLKNVESVTKKADIAIEEVKSMFEKVRDGITQTMCGDKSLGFIVSVLEKISALVAALVAFVRCQDAIARAAIVYTWAAASGLGTYAFKMFEALGRLLLGSENVETVYDFPKDIVNTVKGFFTMQADEDVKVNTFVAIAKAFAHMFGATDKQQAKIDKENMMRFNVFVGSIKGIRDVIAMIPDVITYITHLVFGCPGSEHEKKLLEEITKFMADCTQQLPKDLAKEILVENGVCQKVKELYRNGINIEKMLVGVELPVYYTAPFRNLFALLKNYHNIVVTKERMDNGRIPPIVFFIYGTPGVGKSVASKFIANDVIATMRKEKIPQEQLIYNRNPASEYWDGYFGQPVVLLDDAFQINDVPKLAVMADEIIHMANDASYQLNMAHVEQKAGSFFTSRLVFVTSNTVGLPSEHLLQSDDAFYRRLDFHVQCEISDPKLITKSVVKSKEIEVLDPVEVKKKFGNDFDRNVWTFRFKTPGGWSSETYTYDEIVELACRKWMQRENTGSLNKFLNENAKRYDFDFLTQMDKEFEEDRWKRERFYANPKLDHEYEMRSDVEKRGIAKDQMAQMLKVAEDKAPSIVPQLKLGFEFLDLVKDEDRLLQLNSLVAMETYTQEEFGFMCQFYQLLSWRHENSSWGSSYKKRYEDHWEKKTKELLAQPLNIDPKRQEQDNRDFAEIEKTLWSSLTRMHSDQEAILSMKNMNKVERHELTLTDPLSEKTYEQESRESSLRIAEKAWNNYDDFVALREKEKHSTLQRLHEIYVDAQLKLQKIRGDITSKFTDAFAKFPYDRYKLWKQDLDNRFHAFKKDHPNIGGMLVLGAILSATAGFYGIYRLVSREKSEDEGEEEKEEKFFSQLSASADSTTQRKIRVRKIDPKTRKVIVGERYTMQGESQGLDVAKSLGSNEVRLRFRLKNDSAVLGVFGLFLFEKTLVTVKHFFLNKPPEAVGLYIETCKDPFVVDLKDIVLHDVGPDMVLVHINDPKVRPYTNIGKHIARFSEIKDNLAQVGRMEPSTAGTVIMISNALIDTVATTVVDDYSANTYETNNHMLWFGPNGPGLCGLPYIGFDTKCSKRLLGIHVAGDEREGVAVVHSLEPILDWMVANGKLPKYAPKSQMETTGIKIPESCTIIRHVAKNEKPRMAAKSDIRQSVIGRLCAEKYGPPRTAPAPLRPFSPAYYVDDINDLFGLEPPNEIGDHITVPYGFENLSPAEESIKKFAKPKEELALEHELVLEECAKYIVNQMKNNVEPRLVTIDEALNGVKSWKHSEAMFRNTSRGWPEVVKYHGNGKWPLLICKVCGGKNCGCFGDVILEPEYQKQVLEDIETYKRGVRPEIVFMNCLKDERRKWNKIVAGQARIFNAAPLRHLIVQKIFYQAFVEQMMSDPVFSYSAVGINPDSPQWGMLYNRLNAWGEKTKWLPGDFKNFDFLPKHINRWANWIADRWMTRFRSWSSEEVKQAEFRLREGLYTNTFDGLFLFFGVIYHISMNPSGHLMTTIHNVISNILAHMFCAVSECRERGLPGSLTTKWGPADYDIHFRFTAFGDDHVETTHYEWYTMLIKHKWMSVLGMEYTECDKRPIGSRDHVPAEEVTYLKRRFLVRDGLVFAPLEKEVILEMPYWIRDTTDPKGATTQNAEMAIRQMFHYGRSEFDEYRNTITQMLLKAGCAPPKVPEWTDLYSEFVGVGWKDFKFVTQTKKLKIRKNYKPKKLDTTHVRVKYVVKKGDEYVTSEFKTQMDKEDKTEGLEAKAVATEKQGLTLFADQQETTEEHTAHNSMVWLPADPYENPNLGKALTRVYKVNEFTWSGGDSVGTVLHTCKWPDDLISMNYVHEILSYYEYFKAEVEVTYRINTTGFHYGQLLVSWAPNYAPTGSIIERFASVYHASGNPCSIISAGGQGICKIVVPCIMPWFYWNRSTESSLQSLFALMKVYVLSPLQVATGSSVPSITVSVFANFLKPQVAGYRSTALTFKTQMGEDAERTTKSRGVISSLVDSASKFAYGASVIPHPVAQIGGVVVGTILKGASMLLRHFGYTKNTSIADPQIMIQKVSDNMALSSGLDTSFKLAMEAKNAVGNKWEAFAQIADFDLIDELKQLPCIIDISSFDGTTAVDARIWYRYLDPTDCGSVATNVFCPTHLCNIAMQFTYFHGGLKFMFKFVCSKFTSTRVRLVHFMDVAVPPATFSEGGNVISKIIDITGETTVCITVPYISEFPYLAVRHDLKSAPTQGFAFGTFAMYLVNKVIIPDIASDSTVNFNVWLAGAEDMEFARPSTQYLNIALTVPADKSGAKRRKELEAKDFEDKPKYSFKSQMEGLYDHPRDIFRQPFEPIGSSKYFKYDRVCMGEKVGRMSALLQRFVIYKRYTSAAMIAGTDVAYFNPMSVFKAASTSWPDTSQMYLRTMSTYGFYRGGFRFKIIPRFRCDNKRFVVSLIDDSEISSGPTLTVINDFDQGVAISDYVTRQILEVEVPYYSNQLYSSWYSTGTTSTHGIKVTCLADDPSSTEIIVYDVVVALGEDAMFGFPLAPALENRV